MESDGVTGRYRSRILREMNANRENPFNSPPSSTGSHGTVSPTMTSVFSDPDGESTRKLNEEIARLTGQKSGKLEVNFEAAHQKWPEFYSKPKSTANHERQKSHRQSSRKDHAIDLTKLTSALQAKESTAPGYLSRYPVNDDSTRDPWEGSVRTRSEMQPRVDDNASDQSSNPSKSPARFSMRPDLARLSQQPRARSPLAKTHNRQPSDHRREHDRVDRVDHVRKSQTSPALEAYLQSSAAAAHPAPQQAPIDFDAIRKAFSSPAAKHMSTPAGGPNATANSFFMPDISHLNDFVDGALRLNSYENGVPVFVKHGKVRDQADNHAPHNHAEVDGLAVPEDEEKIFVSMEMLRKEIEDLQEHDDMVQKHAGELQTEVDDLKNQLKNLKSRRSIDSALGSRTGSEPDSAAYEQVVSEKLALESQVSNLQSRLDQTTKRVGVTDIENNTLSLERDRALKKLQDACENIGELMDKLNSSERELNETRRKLDASIQFQTQQQTVGFQQQGGSSSESMSTLEAENKSLKAENETLRREKQSMQEELESLRKYNALLRREHESLTEDNRSLRDTAQALTGQNQELRQNSANLEEELAVSQQELAAMKSSFEEVEQYAKSLKEDHDSLVRHNEKYFEENKSIRRENSGFERSIHDLHDENVRLKDEVEFLKQQLDHCRPIARDDDLSARFERDEEEEGGGEGGDEQDEDDEPEENMTSAFFVPDITIDENSVMADETSDSNKGPPELPTETNKTVEIPDTDGPTEDSLGEPDITMDSQKNNTAEMFAKARKATEAASQGQQKVAFSLPDDTQTSKVSLNVANQGSKRRTASHMTYQSSAKGSSVPQLEPFQHDQDSVNMSPETTRDQSITLDLKAKPRREAAKGQQQKQSKQQQQQQQSREKMSSTSQKTATTSSKAAKSTHQKPAAVDMTSRSHRSENAAETKGNCPALSPNARKVLDDLCEHNCKNCVVCSRITAHRGTVTLKDAAEGKKRISVPAPVPASERQQQQQMQSTVTQEDMTMRPSQDPGHALAMVIKGLEDEAEHMKMELNRLQARYVELEPSLGRRGRKELASEMKQLFRRLENKNDQIYSLYDVLEGQRIARQAMSEQELEMTVFSITGMSVRDHSQQLTFDSVAV